MAESRQITELAEAYANPQRVRLMNFCKFLQWLSKRTNPMANIADLTARIEHAAAALANQAASDAQIAKLSSDLQTAQEALAAQDAAYQAQIDQMAALLPAVDPAV